MQKPGNGLFRRGGQHPPNGAGLYLSSRYGPGLFRDHALYGRGRYLFRRGGGHGPKPPGDLDQSQPPRRGRDRRQRTRPLLPLQKEGPLHHQRTGRGAQRQNFSGREQRRRFNGLPSGKTRRGGNGLPQSSGGGGLHQGRCAALRRRTGAGSGNLSLKTLPFNAVSL